MYSFLRSCRIAGAIGPLRPRFGWECLGVLVAASVLAAEPGKGAGAGAARGMLAMVDRTVTQDQGAWVIDYRLRHTGQKGVIVMPEEIGAKVEGWVSNSRVASHAVPRWSSLVVARGPELSTVSEVIASVDEAQRCRERLLVTVRTEDQGPSRPVPADRGRGEPIRLRSRPRAGVSRRPSCRSAWVQGPSSGSGSGSSTSTSSTAISTPSWPFARSS